ncbi:SEC-C motif-containing protein [Raineyella antarctica]|uniref:UPF0225 protein GA0111570_10494 n=1 Tax=Raineyella antarctica TaxID=1577474 RepID=A0A1G6GM87_9ACTN|nr:YchJ family metal-binding protein [Raineyella antarctica]SDB83121.1 SEC-C motif-containing protein [Raineyella antarctica]
MTPDFCPCQSGRTYDDCCGPLLAGARTATTAEELMRSRYTAFARGDADHLLRTWAPATRPEPLDLDDGLAWRRLQVLETTAGGPGDEEGWVRFIAHYRSGTDRGTLSEHSHFVRLRGSWYYLDGEIG